jgi:hypothetical protein
MKPRKKIRNGSYFVMEIFYHSQTWVILIFRFISFKKSNLFTTNFLVTLEFRVPNFVNNHCKVIS